MIAYRNDIPGSHVAGHTGGQKLVLWFDQI